MLAPDDRTLLADLLAPPGPGYALEHAVATTFTLDLTALLPVVLGLVGADASAATDPLALLQVIRTHADRLDVFCQAGSVVVPNARNDLLAFLEPVVHQVRAPRSGGLFHPKLWVMRFANESGAERYRLVCGSRNLTHDRSWDTVLALEGLREKRLKARNRPLAEFIASLFARVPTGVEGSRRERIEALADGVRFVEWERPDGVADVKDWLTFHIFGGRPQARPDLSGYRRFVVSPFVNAGGIEKAWPDMSGDCVFVSRPEELDKLDPAIRANLTEGAEVMTVNDDAAIPPIESDEAGPQWSLTGLHSKLFVVERNHRAHVFVGSANATDAAWNANDEILVELVGRAGEFGVQRTAGPDAPLREILIDYSPGEAPEPSAEDELKWKLQNALRGLASLTFVANVESSESRNQIRLQTDAPILRGIADTDHTGLKVAPITTANDRHSLVLGKAVSTTWDEVKTEDITPFFVLTISARVGNVSAQERSVVIAKLNGAPGDRLDRILANQIKTPSEFMRFVLLLLRLAEGEAMPAAPGVGSLGGEWIASGGAGLLESVLDALTRAPSAIDQIDRFAIRLRATERGRALLPAGWDDFWPNVMAAAEQIKGAPR